MNALELYNSLGTYIQKLCANDSRHREGIAQENQLSDSQKHTFYALCTNDTTKNIENIDYKSCEEIEKELDEYKQTKKKIIKVQNINDMDETIEIHPKLSTLHCFKICETISAQNRKHVALIINKWNWRILDGIEEELLHEIVINISGIENKMDENKKNYDKSLVINVLVKLDISAAIISKTNNSKTHYINDLCFKFRNYEKVYAKFKKLAIGHQSDLRKAIESLHIGHFDESTKQFQENLVFSYYDFKLKRKTSEIIPKDLYNYTQEINGRIKQGIHLIEDHHKLIQQKRKNKEFTQYITTERSEEWRAKEHKKKFTKKNKKKNEKDGKINKKEKEKKKGGKKEQEKKISNKAKVTHFFKVMDRNKNANDKSDNIDNDGNNSNDDDVIYDHPDKGIGLFPQSHLLCNINKNDKKRSRDYNETSSKQSKRLRTH